MNTFYNLNTNFVRIYGDPTLIFFSSLFLYRQSRAKASPRPRLSPPLVIGNDWKRFLTTLTLKVQQHRRQRTWANFFPLPLPLSLFLPLNITNLNNVPQDQSLDLHRTSSLTAIYSDHEPLDAEARNSERARGSADLLTCRKSRRSQIALCNCPDRHKRMW